MKPFRRLSAIALAFVCALLIPAVALAQAPPDAAANPLGFLDMFLAAIAQHNRPIIVALVFLGLSPVLYAAGKSVPALAGPRAHALVLFFGTAFASFGAALFTAAGHAGLGGVLGSIVIAIIAGLVPVGGWQAFVHLFAPGIVATQAQAALDGQAAAAKSKLMSIPRGPQGGFVSPRAMLALLVLGVVWALGCASYCSQSAHSTEPKCKLNQSTLDCSAAAGLNAEGQAGSVFAILLSNGADYIADLVDIAAKLGPAGAEWVVCEVRAVDLYFASIASGTPASALPPGFPHVDDSDPLLATLRVKSSQVHTRALEVIAHFNPQGVTVVNARLMTVVVK